MISDIKVHLTRRVKHVAVRQQNDTPKDSTYSGVMTRYSVRIVLTVAALYELQVLLADVQNACLNSH